jgi:hypothetical protein
MDMPITQDLGLAVQVEIGVNAALYGPLTIKDASGRVVLELDRDGFVKTITGNSGGKAAPDRAP